MWRSIQGKRRLFAQLIQEGLAPLKYQTRPGESVGLDPGPSMIAVYAERGAALVPLAPEIQQGLKQTRRLQRAMDRSRRATNPQCFNRDGTFKKGARLRVRSQGYERLRNKVAQAQRVTEKTRSRSHGDRIIGLGNVIHAEAISYVAFQRSLGRSVRDRAPGALIATIWRKAERAGGRFEELNTRALRLSQYDHPTQTYAKKGLAERWHALGDGSGYVQRDIYSASPAAQAAGDDIHPSRVSQLWPVAQSLLARAGWMRDNPVSVASVLATAPTLGAPERVAREMVLVRGDAQDAVAATREPARPAESALRTPWLKSG